MTFAAATHALREARPLPLVAAIASYLVGTHAIGLRLRAASRALEIAMARSTAWAIGLSGVLASHLAFGGAAGELARVGWIKSAARGRESAGARAMGVIAVDRVADGIAIAMLVVCALAARAALLTSLAPIALTAAALLVLVAIPRWAPTIERKRLLTGVGDALPAALAAWGLDLARIYFVSLSLATPLSLASVATLALAALIGGQAPTPGGLIAVEGAMIGAGVALGVPGPSIVAIVVVDRALSLGLGTVIGAFASAHLVRTVARRTA